MIRFKKVANLVKQTTVLGKVHLERFFFNNQLKLFLVLMAVSTINILNEFLKALFGSAIPLDVYFFIMWVLLVFLFKLGDRFSIVLGLFFLSLCPLFLTFQASALADQSANAAFFLMALGLLQRLKGIFTSRTVERFE